MNKTSNTYYYLGLRLFKCKETSLSKESLASNGGSICELYSYSGGLVGSKQKFTYWPERRIHVEDKDSSEKLKTDFELY